ncbi:hypothetical protein [Pedobacter sp. NJ-S-72]
MKNLTISTLLRAKTALFILAGMMMLASCKKESEVQSPESPDASTKNVNAAPDVWRKANLTNFESYPAPGSEECSPDGYNGCLWAGQFAFLNGVQPLSWVKSHDIASIHSKDAGKYKLKTLRIRQGSKQLDVKVYDECADSDCHGCCTTKCQ